MTTSRAISEASIEGYNLGTTWEIQKRTAAHMAVVYLNEALEVAEQWTEETLQGPFVDGFFRGVVRAQEHQRSWGIQVKTGKCEVTVMRDAQAPDLWYGYVEGLPQDRLEATSPYRIIQMADETIGLNEEARKCHEVQVATAAGNIGFYLGTQLAEPDFMQPDLKLVLGCLLDDTSDLAAAVRDLLRHALSPA